MYYTTNYTSPIGELTIISDGENLCHITFSKQNNKQSPSQMIENENLILFQKVKQWLNDYFKGLNPKINFKLKPDGTEFRKQVWKIVSEIPYGETMTYGEIASKISKTMSAQAVGGAVGANPISIIIPCHRVIGAKGKLTGYAAGIDVKIELLKIEKIL